MYFDIGAEDGMLKFSERKGEHNHDESGNPLVQQGHVEASMGRKSRQSTSTEVDNARGTETLLFANIAMTCTMKLQSTRCHIMYFRYAGVETASGKHAVHRKRKTETSAHGNAPH